MTEFKVRRLALEPATIAAATEQEAVATYAAETQEQYLMAPYVVGVLDD